MIHHVSIPARNPGHVAAVLAELMGGSCHPFSPLEGAFMAISGDEHGSMIEVYPEQTALSIPQDDKQVCMIENAAVPPAWPFHMLLSVPLDEATVQRIGDREGWRTKTFGRGIPGKPPFFRVIEFWVENRLMIEVATPAMAAEYEGLLKNPSTMAMDPEDVRRMQQSYRRAPAAA
jgi:hypothetical protein